MKQLLRWHRGFGIISCIAIFCWGISGVLHPFMMRLQPQAATFMPPPAELTLDHALPLATVLRQQSISEIQSMHLIQFKGKMLYQVQLPQRSEKLYFDSKSGSTLKNGDKQYAEFLARHYTNDFHSAIKATSLLTRFNDDYNFINRLLPVYQVSLDRPDGLTVYIDTHGARLGTLNNNAKTILSRTFQTLHTWSFLNSNPYAKLLMLIFLACGFCSSISGIYLYVHIKPSASQKLPLRRFHRQLGLLVSITTLTFTFSGAYHLIHTTFPKPTPESLTSIIPTASLQALPSTKIPKGPFSHFSLVMLDKQLYYRVSQIAQQTAYQSKDAEHHEKQVKTNPLSPPEFTYINAVTGQTLSQGEEKHAIRLASFYSRLPQTKIKSISQIHQFNDEYGFIFKRLPVYRIEYNAPSHDRYFVETDSSQLAAHITDADATEGKTFALIHKWAFLGKQLELRDLLVTFFAFGNALIALTGLLLWQRSRRQKI